MTIARRAAEECLPLRPVVFQVLLALADGERHGYAIVHDISERSAARLQLMLDEGFIEESGRRPLPGKDDERRRYYRITKFGRQVALAEAARLEALAGEARARLAPRTQGRA
jgi:DNA-binding PadR family transcriptional regulator